MYWRDADIVESAPEILEDLIAHDKDVIVPNVWFHRYEERDGKMVDVEGRFDYNSWIETDKARKLAATLAKDDILVEGMFECVVSCVRYEADWGQVTQNIMSPAGGI